MATHSSILAWEIPWTEEAGGLYNPWGCKSLTRLSDFTTTLTQVLDSPSRCTSRGQF